MAVKYHNPPSVKLVGNYSHGAELAPGMRTLYLAGQVGVDSKGKLQSGIEKQCEQAWKNIAAILRSAAMDYSNIVKLTTFLTDPRFILPNRAVREKLLKPPYPASTLLIVNGLADPHMLVEIELVAAK